MNLAKDNASWERSLSVTPIPHAERRQAALRVAAQAEGPADCRALLEHLGLLDPALRRMAP